MSIEEVGLITERCASFNYVKPTKALSDNVMTTLAIILVTVQSQWHLIKKDWRGGVEKKQKLKFIRRHGSILEDFATFIGNLLYI